MIMPQIAPGLFLFTTKQTHPKNLPALDVLYLSVCYVIPTPLAAGHGVHLHNCTRPASEIRHLLPARYRCTSSHWQVCYNQRPDNSCHLSGSNSPTWLGCHLGSASRRCRSHIYGNMCGFLILTFYLSPFGVCVVSCYGLMITNVVTFCQYVF